MSSASDLSILEFDRICFSYGKNNSFIKDLSLSIREGEFIGLLGANGSGKSTILKLGGGILKPSAGRLTLWGKVFHGYNNKDRAKLISYMPQSIDVTVPFTIRELVGMGLYPYDIRPTVTTDEALSMVGLLDRSDDHLTDLSGGEQRRTFIAMTLLQGAGLLLLDEPLVNLDIRYQIELVRLLKRLKKERNISIVMALHDINIALQLEKVMLIKNGAMLGIGPPSEILTEGLIREAFDVDVKIIRQPDGNAYAGYEAASPAGWMQGREKERRFR
jgi:ABC-type cobalamin/Fe3+-siderophores transport system ATPase subunit